MIVCKHLEKTEGTIWFVCRGFLQMMRLSSEEQTRPFSHVFWMVMANLLSRISYKKLLLYSSHSMRPSSEEQTRPFSHVFWIVMGNLLSRISQKTSSLQLSFNEGPNYASSSSSFSETFFVETGNRHFCTCLTSLLLVY